jgi:hypothetical protein
LRLVFRLGAVAWREGPPSPRAAGSSSSTARSGAGSGRKRPKNRPPHYSGKKEAHTDENVLSASASDDRVLFLGPTCPGKTHDKRIADEGQLAYPPDTTRDTGFPGYEPPVQRTCRAEKSRGGAS